MASATSHGIEYLQQDRCIVAWSSTCETRYDSVYQLSRNAPVATMTPRRQSPFTDRFAKAFAYSVELHGDQIRKSKNGDRVIPYIAHLMSVAALVLEHGGSEEEAIAALLHDGPEDRGGRETLAIIEREFGSSVAAIVVGCSDTLELEKPEWKKRKADYIEHLKANNNDSVFLVSLADKVHNLRSILEDYRRIGDALWERFTGNRDGTLWYYEALLEIYEEKAPARCEGLIEEMRRVYDQIVAEAGL